MTKLFVFLREVKIEAAKIYWPSRKETATIGALVLGIMVSASLFFLMMDAVIYKFVQLVLGI